MFKKVSFIVYTFLIFMLAACGSSSDGQNAQDTEDYPNDSIKIIVPWDAGGDTDAVYRIVGEELSEVLDQNVIIENIAGGSGIIGSQEALTSKNDGYTMLAIHESLPMSDLMGQADFGIDDFQPIALMTSSSRAIATSVDSPWDDMEDLLDDEEDNPGDITFAASIGSITQLEPAMLQTAADVEFNIVGFDGTAERMKAVVGNDVDLATVSVTAGKEYLDDGRMKLLGFGGEERNEQIPDIETLKEQGIDVVSSTNRGLAFPKDTPEEIIEKMSEALQEVAEDSDFQKQIEDTGSEVNFIGSDQYADYLIKEEEDIEKSLINSDLIDE